jgi:hypothetical protein
VVHVMMVRYQASCREGVVVDVVSLSLSGQFPGTMHIYIGCGVT